jgi:hypothetical protein
LYKIIRGYLKDGTNNFYAFDPNWIITYELEENKSLFVNIKQLTDMDNKFKDSIEQLQNTEVKRATLSSMLGNWIDKCLTASYDNGFHSVKLSTKDVIDVYTKLFVSNKSNKFIPSDKKVTMFDIYKEMIEIISDDDKDIINRFEKTINYVTIDVNTLFLRRYVMAMDKNKYGSCYF